MLKMTTFIFVVLVIGFSGFVKANSQWNIITEVRDSAPLGASVLSAGPDQQPFARPPPRMIDPNLISDFQESFSMMQDISSSGDNTLKATSKQFVATVKDAMIEGESGLIYDIAGNVFHLQNFFYNRTNTVLPLPQHSVAQTQQQCIRYKKLATVIQRYGHMYYHFLEETLPRIILLKNTGVLTSNTKLLTWGQPYEQQYLDMLGITSEQVVKYDPEAVYCADSLLIPTPTPRITPPREGLMAVREALKIKTLPEDQRNTIVYVSRANEPTRAVANEADILRSIQTAFPSMELVVFAGGKTAKEMIELFQRAKVIMGPHGAGLSHMLFAAPGTTVVEFLFMADPPMMFWHSAAALNQQYWLLPVPESYYMQPSMEVPVGEVLDILQAAIGPTPASNACPPGKAGPSCSICPAGSYAYNADSTSCKLCAPGRVSTKKASTYCSTCAAGTYSSPMHTRCDPCPKGTYSPLPGSSNAGACLKPEARRKQLEEHAFDVQMLSKLSPTFNKAMARRALIQGKSVAQLTPQEICQARRAAGINGDIYQGPYMQNATDTVCPPQDTVAMPSPPPYGLPPTEAPPPVQIMPPTPKKEIQGEEPSTPTPSPAPVDPVPDQEPVYSKKPLLDGWIIALLVLIGVFVIIPLFVFAIRAWRNKRRRDREAKTAATRSSTTRKNSKVKKRADPLLTSNSTFDVNADGSSA